MKQKNWFFEKNNNIVKPLANLTKIRREKNKLVISETKKGDNKKHQGNP
jgi:hypothetical protein